MILNKQFFSEIDDTHKIVANITKSFVKNSDEIEINQKIGLKKIVFINHKPYTIVKSDKLNLIIQPKLLTDISKNTDVIQKCFLLYYNHIQHQFGNTECGVYSIYFLTELALGKSYKEIIKKKINDKTMNEYRNKFFKPNNLETKN